MGTQLKRVKYAVVTEALAGEIDCGDQYLVKKLEDSILVVVVDGLGHGMEAAFAAKKAINIIDTHANQPLETLVTMCDQELKETRGVAMTIARFDRNYTLTYMGIGNVMAVCWQLNENAERITHSLLLQSGIVGSKLPSPLLQKNMTMKPGDVFILATDGIDGKFEIETPKLESLETISKRLFKTYRNPLDDGLILVAQFL